MPSNRDREREEIALAVGQVAIEAAWLEYFASMLAGALIGSVRADPFVFGQGWRALHDGLLALLEEAIAAAVDDADGRNVDIPFYRQTIDHLRIADKLMTQRNNVVHAIWSLPNESGERDAVTHKRWRAPHLKTWSPGELDALRQNLNLRMAAISSAVDRVMGPDA